MEFDGSSSNSGNQKKKYRRHTPEQIQQLEAFFRECPHPNEQQRIHLSRVLRLRPHQIRFWFQNHRTQLKTKREREDNYALRVENDRICNENFAINEALKKIICPTCDVAEQRIRMENEQLRQEIERVSRFIDAMKLTQPPPHETTPVIVAPAIQPTRNSSQNFRGFPNVDHGFVPPVNLRFLHGSSNPMTNELLHGCSSSMIQMAEMPGTSSSTMNMAGFPATSTSMMTNEFLTGSSSSMINIADF